METKWLSDAERLSMLNPLTRDFNDYLASKELGRIPERTGNTMEDIALFAQSQGMSEELMNYIEWWIKRNIVVLFTEKRGSALSKLAYDWLIREFESKGPKAVSEVYRSFSQHDHEYARELFGGLLMSSVYMYDEASPRLMDIEASFAAHDPERFDWLINTRGLWSVNYCDSEDMVVTTELVCLTLIKCFENSATEVQFKREFKRLYSTYVGATSALLHWQRKELSTVVEYLCVLLSDIKQSYGLIEDYGYLDTTYYKDYKRAMVLACDVYGVSLADVFSNCPNAYGRNSTPSSNLITMDFFTA